MKLIKQTDYNDCSIACLCMIINHFYNKQYDLDLLKFENEYENNILSFFDIHKLSKKYYLNCEAFKIENDINELKTDIFMAQIINENEMLHFVIVKKINNSLLSIFDPSKNSSYKIDIINFYNFFTGNILIFTPNNNEYAKSYLNTRNILLKNFYNVKKHYLISYFSFSILASFITIIETRFMKVYFQSFTFNVNYISIYIFFILLYSISLITNKIGIAYINVAYEKKKNFYIKKLCNFIKENNINVNYFKLYNEILFISDFEVKKFGSLITSIITTIIIMMYIYFTLNLYLFLFILLEQLILILITNIKYFLSYKKNSAINDDIDISYILTNIDNIKQTSNYSELKFLNKSNNKIIQINLLDFLLLILEKTLFFIIFFISWPLLKFNFLNFNIFIIILLLKNILTNSFKNINYFLRAFKKYSSIYRKISIMLKENKLITLKEINSIEILNLKTNDKFYLNDKISYLPVEYDLLLLNKTVSNNNEILIKINNYNIKDISVKSFENNIYYINENNILFGTILKNIILDSKENIFVYREVKSLLMKYNINLGQIINKENIKKVEKEIIKILKIFYVKSKIIILNYTFEIIEIDDIKIIINLFNKINNNKIIITNKIL